MNELVRAKNVPARQCLENAAEDRFVKAELLLDGFCREPDLPTNMALTRRDTALDERKLNAIGVIERQPVEIGSREELAALTGDPEILYSTREIKRHRGPHRFRQGSARRCICAFDEVILQHALPLG